MSDFYRDDQTRRAEAVLRQLREIVPTAIILGGWATFLYTGGQRSTDIDIAVDYAALGVLKERFGTLLSKNQNLRKYEIKTNGVEIDVFVLHLSNAGVPIEEVVEPTQHRQGFRVINPEGLLVLKLCAWIDRRNRVKGDKDEADILSLLLTTILDWDRYRRLAGLAGGKYHEQVRGAIARVVNSSEVRGTWRFTNANGQPLINGPVDWKRAKEQLRKTVPLGL